MHRSWTGLNDCHNVTWNSRIVLHEIIKRIFFCMWILTSGITGNRLTKRPRKVIATLPPLQLDVDSIRYFISSLWDISFQTAYQTTPLLVKQAAIQLLPLYSYRAMLFINVNPTILNLTAVFSFRHFALMELSFLVMFLLNPNLSKKQQQKISIKQIFPRKFHHVTVTSPHCTWNDRMFLLLINNDTSLSFLRWLPVI